MPDHPKTPRGPIVRARVVVEGRVQGVGFRFHTCEQAQKLCVGGYVRNQWDGTVLIEVEGKPPRVQQMIKWLHRGPTMAYVSGTSVSWVRPLSGEDASDVLPRFEVRY